MLGRVSLACLWDALSRVMALVKYVEDMEIFRIFRNVKLSRRPVHGASASDEVGASVDPELEELCAFEYANKLQCIFADISPFKDLTHPFRGR
ncbi:hypothetical protein BKA70DRAFT_1434507 [Coprinopsis sp. MPI-PUGE-AT-0042]|nr:hypothetical protein BKA70DRAFT_1434507 [Coprinopsis sp. MPI-PUGE-AT-0042]